MGAVGACEHLPESFRQDLKIFHNIVHVSTLESNTLKEIGAIASMIFKDEHRSRFTKAMRLFPLGRSLLAAVVTEVASIEKDVELTEILERLERMTGAWATPATLTGDFTTQAGVMVGVKVTESLSLTFAKAHACRTLMINKSTVRFNNTMRERLGWAAPISHKKRCPFKGPRVPFKGPRGPLKGPRGPLKGHRDPCKRTPGF